MDERADETFCSTPPISYQQPDRFGRAHAWCSFARGLAQYISRRGVLVARTLHGPVVDERETLGVALSSLLPMRHITPSPARPSYSLWLRVAPIDLSQCDQLPDLGSTRRSRGRSRKASLRMTRSRWIWPSSPRPESRRLTSAAFFTPAYSAGHGCPESSVLSTCRWAGAHAVAAVPR
jgi:hypothetical protein